MNKQIIHTDNAPQPIGPYNQAILTNDMLYASGQIAIDPMSGKLVLTSIEDETHQVMKNIEAILNNANMSFENIVKCTIFIKDMRQFTQINTVYATYFNEKTAPARETVEVSRLPKDVNIEISFIAAV